ncbi:hypothetical protein RB594_008951 [Gaeumannomyces avenae]
MNRLFGSADKAPKPTIDQTVTNLQKRVSEYDVQIKEKNNELSALAKEMRASFSAARKETIKKKMRRILVDRGGIEKRQGELQGQLDNLWRTQDMQTTLQNSMVVVDALKTTTKELKRQYGKVDLDKIERMQDEMADLMDVGAEINDAISRGIGMPEDLDEAELDAELDALGDEAEYEFEMQRASATPGFLEDEVPDFVDEPLATDKTKMQEAAR